MTEDKRINRGDKLLNSLLNTYSSTTIIEIFREIEGKIAALHKCSSDDFLMLNSDFKKYFKTSKQIAENASHIIEIISGKDNVECYNDLNDLNVRLKSHVEYFENQINFSIGSLEKILTLFSKMYLPLKNFKQNIMTLKFLAANLKLSISCSGGDDEGIAEELKKIDTLIEKINNVSPIIERLAGISKVSLARLHDIKGRNIYNIEKTLRKLNSSINLLSEKHKESVRQGQQLNEMSENFSNSVAKIITNLQFHDIIRQKMEHIQATLKGVMANMEKLDSSADSATHVNTIAKLFIQVRDVSGLQAAQLILINKEYQEAIRIITDKFLTIHDGMLDVSTKSNDFSGLRDDTEDDHFKIIRYKLENVISIIHDFTSTNRDFIFEVDTIHIEIERVSNGFHTISRLNDEIEQLALVNIAAEYPHMENIVDQMKVLSHAAGLIVNNVELLFKKVLDLSVGLHQDHEKFAEYNINETHSELTDSVKKILSLLTDNSEKVFDLNRQNTEISNDVSSEIKSTIKKVKYYDYFEKVIEEIIIEFNAIYFKLKNETPDDIENSRAKNLKYIEGLYTMHTERLIHEKVLGDKEHDEIFENFDGKEEDDDNLELF